MKHTAVEWLQVEIDNKDMGEIPMWIYELLEQAKAIEKEQIIESYCQGCLDITNDETIFPRETSEQYYKETFKQK